MKKYVYTALFMAIPLIMMIRGCKTGRDENSELDFNDPTLDSCLIEPDHQYYISLPDHLHSKQALPLVLIIDPHGDGLTAMQKFRAALKGLPLVLVGSEKLRNNYDGFEASLNNLRQDILGKYPVDPHRVIVAGFSGGARMAFYYGLKHPVKGIIMFGAGPDPLPTDIQGKQIYAVSGTRDFNFIEQYRPLFSGIPNNMAYLNDYFRGIHEWPPERYLRESVVYCLRGDAAFYKELSEVLSGAFLEEFDSLQNANAYFFAGKALEKSWYFATKKSSQKEILYKINAFEHHSEWFACQKEMVAFLAAEDRIKHLYAENLVNPDMEWWTGQLDTLFMKIREDKDPLEQDYYSRLKGFLGIYLYSRINQLLMANNSTDLTDSLLAIYERVEPQSEDLVHFKKELSRLKDAIIAR